MTLTPLGLDAFALDSTGAQFLILFAVVWGLSAIYAATTISREDRTRFWAYYAPAAIGGLLVALAQDAISFYFAFALTALPSWGLISHNRTDEARRSGRVYLAVTVVSEMLLLAALMLMASDAGSMRLAEMRDALATSPYATVTMVLVLGSVALKIGSLGLNGILPLSYTYTPTGAAAALAGASVKVGALALLRLLPFGVPALESWGVACIAVGLATAFVAAVLGVFTTVPKSVLGYSSASQMGLVLVAVGAGLAGDASAATGAVVAYSIHHGLAKTSLFFGEDIAAHSSGRSRLVSLLVLVIPSLALIGAPFTSGFVAKYSLYSALYEVSAPIGGIARSMLPWAAMGTAALMARFLSLVGSAEAPTETRNSVAAGAWLVTILLTTTTVWAWPAEWAADAAHHATDASSLWGATWPILVVGGVALGLKLVGKGSYGGFVRPGDWMVGIDALMARAATSPDRPAAAAKDRSSRTSLSQVLAAEGMLTAWMVAGSIFLLLAVGIALLASY